MEYTYGYTNYGYTNYGYSNYYPYTNYNHNQILDNRFKGLPNQGNTCYINVAIQHLKQLYYYDQTIFGSSDYAKDFKDLFEHLEKGNLTMIDYKLDDIIRKSKQNQDHFKGGDAFICVNNFFNEIKQSLNQSNQIKQFDNNFLLQYTDYLWCTNCNKKIKDTETMSTVNQQEMYGNEVQQLKDAFTLDGDLELFKQVNSANMACNRCSKKQFDCIREYQKAPNFMMIKLSSRNSYQQFNSNIFENEFNINVQGQALDHKYQIIGFCSHMGNHYKYIAKYENDWIEFNDLKVSFTQNLTQYNPFYFVLKKINDNSMGSLNKNKQYLSQKVSKQEEQWDSQLKKENNQRGYNHSEIGLAQNKPETTNKNYKDSSPQTNSLNSKQQRNNFQNFTFENPQVKTFMKVSDQLSSNFNQEYMIPSIIALFQIFFTIDENLFGESKFQKEFNNLVNTLINQAKDEIQKYLPKQFNKDNEYEKNSEAFSYFLDYLNDAFDKIPFDKQNKFQSNFLISYQDYYKCKSEKCKYKKIISEIVYTVQELEIQNKIVDGKLIDNLIVKYQKIKCVFCRENYQYQVRQYNQVPKFMIAKQISPEINRALSDNPNKIFNLRLINSKIESYQIIGFCSIQNNLYTYTAKCEKYWIEFQSQQQHNILIKPDFSKAQYFVLQKNN